VSLSGTPRDSPNRSTHRGFVPTFHAMIRQTPAYSCSSAQWQLCSPAKVCQATCWSRPTSEATIARPATP